MNEDFYLTTDRLVIRPLEVEDARFILELVNTDGWIRFIGDRNIHSEKDAVGYIQKISGSNNMSYWAVRLKEHDDPIGVITCIQRDYLKHPDIGFAFLPAYTQKGYAYEATLGVLEKIVHEKKYAHIHAVANPDNIRSVSLLNKLGLAFEKEVKVNEQPVFVYGCTAKVFEG